MRIHHFNCGTLCPRGARFINGEGGLLEPGRLVCHCLLIETSSGLVLVDTGLGVRALTAPRVQLGGPFVALGRPSLDPEETAERQIQRLGFSPDEVRHIIITHLDADHSGGLSDFPTAKVHVHAAEHSAAIAQATYLEKTRYRPAHWAHNPSWVLHGEGGEPWFGFACVRDLRGLPPEILLIPLAGHTRGHAGVAVSTPDGWLLHAGDAYFHHVELSPEGRAPRGLELFQRIMAFDDAARLRNQARLRELCRDHGKEVCVISAHDAVELERRRELERARATLSAA